MEIQSTGMSSFRLMDGQSSNRHAARAEKSLSKLKVTFVRIPERYQKYARIYDCSCRIPASMTGGCWSAVSIGLSRLLIMQSSEQIGYGRFQMTSTGHD